MDESVNLKRSCGTSPTGTKAKKITKVSKDMETPEALEIKILEMKEYMNLMNKECKDVKDENLQLRKTLMKRYVLKKENLSLTKQLKEKDLEAVKVMKAIEERMEEETNTAMKSIEKEIM